MLMAPWTEVFERLHRVVLVVDRRGRTGQVVDLVDLDIERGSRRRGAANSKRGLAVQVVDVALGRGEQIVGADDLVALLQQSVDEVRAEEAGSARHQGCAWRLSDMGGKTRLRLSRRKDCHHYHCRT